ncbi:MAG: helix-turn-helix transcriptional regulator [Victivallales bacterium]|nr:helix-turn-helix transcriptional regulator [Victivallales bacterium]
MLLLYPHDTHGFTECETLGLLNIMYVPAKLPIPILDGERIPLFRRFFPLNLDQCEYRSTAEPVLRFNSPEDLERVTEDARMLSRELTSHQPGNLMCGVIRLLSIITLTLRLGQPLVDDTTERRHFTMGKVLEFLNKNFTRRISLEELYRMAACSPSTFQRKFKTLTGYRPTEYIARKRIAMAQELLLKKPDLSIGELGFECGYIDSVYFCRKFRQITKMTPQGWRLAKAARPMM